MRCRAFWAPLVGLAALVGGAGCLDLDAMSCTRNSDCALGLQCGVDGLCAKPPDVDAGAEDGTAGNQPGGDPASPDAGTGAEPDGGADPDSGADPGRPFDPPDIHSDLPLSREPTP